MGHKGIANLALGHLGFVSSQIGHIDWWACNKSYVTTDSYTVPGSLMVPNVANLNDLLHAWHPDRNAFFNSWSCLHLKISTCFGMAGPTCKVLRPYKYIKADNMCMEYSWYAVFYPVGMISLVYPILLPHPVYIMNLKNSHFARRLIF